MDMAKLLESGLTKYTQPYASQPDTETHLEKLELSEEEQEELSEEQEEDLSEVTTQEHAENTTETDSITTAALDVDKVSAPQASE